MIFINSLYWFILIESILAISIGFLWGTYEWAKAQTADKLLVLLPAWALRKYEGKDKAIPIKRLIFFLIVLTLITTVGAGEAVWYTYYYFWPPLKEVKLMIIPLITLPIELFLYYFFLIRLINLLRKKSSDYMNGN